MCHLNCPYLIYIKVGYLQKLVSIFRDFWDFDVQLQVPDWKGAQVLNLYGEN